MTCGPIGTCACGDKTCHCRECLNNCGTCVCRDPGSDANYCGGCQAVGDGLAGWGGEVA